MPDTRTHRGPHPEDALQFGAAWVPPLRNAAHDLNWLLDRGYPITSSVALVGNRYNLSQRQRMAVGRSCCSSHQLDRRAAHFAPLGRVAGAEIWIDAYNQLITVESALGGGALFVGRDSCMRDLASLHGTYRRVDETATALGLLGNWLAQQHAAHVRWIIDRPVSNSGRLAEEIRALAAERGWPWDVILEFSPDAVLALADGVVATHDSAILDRCMAWCDVARAVVQAEVPDAWIVELGSGPDAQTH